MLVGGKGSPAVKKMISVTESSLWEGIAKVRPGAHLGDIGAAVEKTLRRAHLGVIENYVGHGIGADLHESPDVPNFGTPGRGARLCNGMALAIEPMVNVGAPEVLELSDGWTVKTVDHSLSAHYENTVVLIGGEVHNLTLIDPQF